MNKNLALFDLDHTLLHTCATASVWFAKAVNTGNTRAKVYVYVCKRCCAHKLVFADRLACALARPSMLARPFTLELACYAMPTTPHPINPAHYASPNQPCPLRLARSTLLVPLAYL